MELLPWYLTGVLSILLLTAFVKILTTLSILRYGIGLEGFGFGIVIVAVSLGLSLLVMAPELQRAGGVDALLNGGTPEKAIALEKNFTPFLKKHTDPEVAARLAKLSDEIRSGQPIDDAPADTPLKEQAVENVAFPVLVSAFLVSELAEAFHIGFLILIPFLVIDLLVVNVLMSLGITQISQAVVALPLKILLFFAVDGWALITEKLIRTYIS